MVNVELSEKFKKVYKASPEIIRKQTKLAIKKLANNPSDKTLKTKIDKCSNEKVYESFINPNCNLRWKCTNHKNILLLDISSKTSLNDTLNALYEIDNEISVQKKQNYKDDYPEKQKKYSKA